MNEDELIASAARVAECAYAPYSGFKVGAALLSKTGKVYCGCNIENASYGGTICAERAAFCAAISAGEREFECIVIVGSNGEPAYPCGMCRQVMSEFCNDEFKIIIPFGDKKEIFTLRDLLPHRFEWEKK